ncbi:Gfo/Idh/MocA family protein [Rhodococcus sp. NPDC059968]|uniref:Gfo/Idh/MocA family protein n=1 Tax=Rhodococcus sp. NPDC059968 TaxID=3347017 RepID=UPI00366BA16F
MTEPLRYILVGLGDMGAFWASHTLPPAQERGLAMPVAVVDTNSSRFAIAEESLGIRPDQCFSGIEAALASTDCDFVIVVVPPVAHEAVATAAIDAGKHVLCEKPIADTLEASIRIADRANAVGVKMAITMSHRFDQDKQTLIDRVQSGEFGRLNYLVYRCTWNRRRFGDWGEFRHRMQHPMLIEGSVHHFEIIRSLTSSDAKTVYARTWNPEWGEYAGDSTVLAIVEMENGTRCLYEGAQANASTLNGWGQDYIRAECEDATLVLDRRRLSVVRSGSDGLLTTTELPLSQERSEWKNSALLTDFCTWLRGGPTMATHVADNLQCTALLFGAIQSGQTHMPVDVQDLLKSARHDARTLTN